MPSSIIASANHPKPDFTTITQLGLKAYNLAVLHSAVIDPRLPPDTITGLGADLDTLGVVVPGAKQAHVELQVAAAQQAGAVRAGYERVRAIRRAVRKSGAPKEVRKAYGVGIVINAGVTSDVRAAIQQILGRAKDNPAEAAGLGIVQKDLDALAAAEKSIAESHATQGKLRASAPLTTQERNRTANRILKAVARIAGAGILEFASDPDTLASFEDLEPPREKRPTKKTPKPHGGEPPKPAPTPPSDPPVA